MTLILSLLFGCADEPGRTDPPGEDFQGPASVRVLAPTDGESVASPFVLVFEAGADVAGVRLDSGDDAVVALTAVEGGAGEFVVDLPPGRRALALVGEGADGAELSRHDLTVRVLMEEEDPYVTITSPTDGGAFPSPVVFTFAASAEVASVALTVDGAPVGSVDPDRMLPVALEGSLDLRHAEARAYDADGALVAVDELSFTALPGTDPAASAFNARVSERLATYPTDGSYAYWWPDDTDWYGTTQDIYYLGELVAYGDPEHRSYCVGLTLEVLLLSFFALDAESGGDGSLNGLTVEDLTDFRVDWFVRDLWGDGPGVALEGYGLGERVTDLEDVRPGDFIQFWRHSGSGHNAIFVDWERDPADDAIIGVRYWSTQGSTSGIDYNEEFFGSSGSRIDPSYFYASRMAMPEDWIPWM